MLFSLVCFLVGRIFGTGQPPNEGREIEPLVLGHQVRVLQVGHEVVLVQWRRGRKLVVWPPAVSEARPLYPRRRRG